MAVSYTKDPNGVVHIIDKSGDGEFTLCGLEQGCGNMDVDQDGAPTFGNNGEFEGERSAGPSNCKGCRNKFVSLKEMTLGAKWSKKLIWGEWE